MARIVLEVSDDVELFWRALALQAGIPLEGWIAWCCSFVSLLGLPIRDVVLGQAPVERELTGVAWEVRTHDSVESSHGPEVSDNTVPLLDVRTGIRWRKASRSR